MRKRISSLLVLLCLASPAWATWARVQHKINAACTLGTNCVINGLTAVKAHDVLVFAVWFAAADSTLTLSSVSGDAACSSAVTSSDSTAGTVSACYITNATGGENSVTFTPSAATTAAYKAEVIEYSANSPAFDTSGTLDNSSATTKPTGPANLTLSGSNDAIVQFIRAQSNITTPSSVTRGLAVVDINQAVGVADTINNLVGGQPTWFTASGNASALALAFKDSGGSGGSTRAGSGRAAGPTRQF